MALPPQRHRPDTQLEQGPCQPQGSDISSARRLLTAVSATESQLTDMLCAFVGAATPAWLHALLALHQPSFLQVPLGGALGLVCLLHTVNRGSECRSAKVMPRPKKPLFSTIVFFNNTLYQEREVNMSIFKENILVSIWKILCKRFLLEQ